MKDKKSGKFIAGESGNPKGRKKGSISISSAFKKKLNAIAKTSGKKNLAKFIEMIWDMAVEQKNENMIKLICGYVESPPTKGLSINAEDPVTEINVKIITSRDEAKASSDHSL